MSDRSSSDQISLFPSRETPDLWRKATEIVHSKPKQPMSLVQRKCTDSWLRNAIETTPDEQGWFRMSIAKMAEDTGFDSNNRAHLKEAADGLMQIAFEWNVMALPSQRLRYKASVLFPEIEIGASFVRYQVSNQLRGVMLNPEVFAIIDSNLGKRFRRAPAYALWQFCTRYERLSQTAAVNWEELRDQIMGEGAGSKTYQEYKFFKSKVLLPSIKELNSIAPIDISLHESKVGRRISTVQFVLKRKPEAVEAASEDDVKSLELIGSLVKLGLPQSEAKRLTKSSPPSDVRAALDYTQKRLADKRPGQVTLDNPPAYFRTALAHGYGNSAEDIKVKAGKSSANAASSPGVDLRDKYMSRQREEAERYFRELDTPEQTALIERYNAFQTVEALRVKKKATRGAESAFFRWLATDVWGEPSETDLLEFAQQLLAAA